MKVGLVFAGQGAQYPGMGKDLYDNFALAREIFDDAGEEVKDWCFNGTKEMLRQTHITQPSIYTVTMAAYKAFLEAAEREGLDKDIEIVGYGGFSLGEYSALTAAGSIKSIHKGLEVVQIRGNLMEEAGADENGEQRGGMAAGFGKREAIEALVEKVKGDRILEAVNYNSPIQTVVAGEKAALADFVAASKEAGVKAKMLSVSTAFHCAMMKPAAEKLLPVLKTVGFEKPERKVYSNIWADDIMKEYDGGDVNEYLAGVMARQVESPVRFEEVIRKMVADGIELVIEIGPGHTLSGFVKKIDRKLPCTHVEDHESLEHTIGMLKEALA